MEKKIESEEAIKKLKEKEILKKQLRRAKSSKLISRSFNWLDSNSELMLKSHKQDSSM